MRSRCPQPPPLCTLLPPCACSLTLGSYWFAEMLSARPPACPGLLLPLPIRPVATAQMPCAGMSLGTETVSSLRPLCFVCFNYNLSDFSALSTRQKELSSPTLAWFQCWSSCYSFFIPFFEYYCHITHTFKVGNVMVRYMYVLQNDDHGKVS